MAGIRAAVLDTYKQLLQTNFCGAFSRFGDHFDARFGDHFDARFGDHFGVLTIFLGVTYAKSTR